MACGGADAETDGLRDNVQPRHTEKFPSSNDARQHPPHPPPHTTPTTTPPQQTPKSTRPHLHTSAHPYPHTEKENNHQTASTNHQPPTTNHQTPITKEQQQRQEKMLPLPRTLLRVSSSALPVSVSKPSIAKPVVLPARHSSTTTTATVSTPTTNAATATTATAGPRAAPGEGELDWNAFLQLRRLRRRYNLASSIFTSFVSTSVGMGYLANKEIDVTQTIFGMDPLIMFGLATIGCGAAGWLVGPSLGGAAFNVVKKRWIAQIAEVRSPPPCPDVLFCSALSCPVLSCPVLFCAVLSCPALFCSVLSFALFHSVLFCLFCSVCSALFWG